MGKDKKKPQTLKNPSVREKFEEILDPTRELTKRIWHLESHIKELNNELGYTKKNWQKHYSRMCLFFLIMGIVIGAVSVGVILL